MPCFRQPQLLQSTLHSLVVRNMLAKYPCTVEQRLEFYKNQQRIREYYSVLPETVKLMLAERASNIHKLEILRQRAAGTYDERQYYPIELYLLDIFVSDKAKNVEIRLYQYITPRYWTRILQLMSQHSGSLETMKFKCDTYPIMVRCSSSDCQLLQRILSSGTNLTHLTLHRVCTDEVLKVIGRNCYQLEALDVTKSPISDIGLNHLTQHVIAETNVFIVKNIWNMDTTGVSTYWKFTDVFPPISDLLTPEEKTFYALKRYERKKNPVCATLRRLKLYGHHVTFKGLLLVLELIPDLEYLIHNMDELFKCLIERDWIRPAAHLENPLKLKKVLWSDISREMLHILLPLCPDVLELEFSRITENVINLNFIPLLRSLTIRVCSSPPYFQRILQQYLITNGYYLRHLSLGYDRNFPDETAIDLKFIFTNCNHLVSFSLVTHATSSPPVFLKEVLHPLANLNRLHLDAYITECTVINLMRSAPTLTEMYVRQVVKVEDNTFVPKMCDVVPRPDLKMFWIADDYFTEDEEELAFFINSFNHIKTLGCLPSELNKNFEFKLYSEDEE